MSQVLTRNTKLQWIAALIILGAAFLGPHVHMPASQTFYRSDSQASSQDPGVQALFASNTAVNELSYRSRDELLDRFGDIYRRSPYFNQQMERATSPKFGNFNDFLLSPQEIIIRFPRGTVAPGIEGTVSIALPIKDFLAYMRPEVVVNYLPNQQKAYQDAQQSLARQMHTQNLVNQDRSNVNCAVMKCIALTFDDGPDGEKGRRIIETLKDRKAVGTFFVLGSRVLKTPEEVKIADAYGNEIGNHTWDHSHLPQLSDAAITEQITATDRIIIELIGKKPNLVRPPYADYNSHVISLVNRPAALWNIDTRDWANRNADAITAHVMARAHPGAVILFHSIYGTTAAAMPRIVDYLQAKGYVLVTMSEMYKITPQNVAQYNGVKLFGR